MEQMIPVFIENDFAEWKSVSPGVQRTIIAYDASVMVVKVLFEKGAVGDLHQHPHVQISYIVSGIFEIEVGGVKKVLKQGDSFFAASNIWHGVLCIEAGMLLDTFSPMRNDFVPLTS